MSKKTFNLIFTIIGLIGVANGIYLSVLKLTNNSSMCIKGLGDCFTVNTSKYSEIFGVPIAILGTLAYLALLALVFLENKGNGFWKANAVYFFFGFTLIGAGYSAYLTYLEADIIRAWCPFCVMSAIGMWILFITTIVRLVNFTQAEPIP